MFEQTFKNIDDILHKDAGCTSELDYTEQSSWLIVLQYLDALEADKAMKAELEGRECQYILAEPFRWSRWAAPKDANGKIDLNRAATGPDLMEMANQRLLPYWPASSNAPAGRKPSNTRSVRSSARSRTRSRAATTCAT